MAKPKFPKKASGANESIINPTPQPAPIPEANLAPVETSSASTPMKKSATRKPAAKPEIVKSEPRANLVPINLENEIRQLAYLMSERRGFAPGHEAEDWIAAEREVLARYRQQSA